MGSVVDSHGMNNKRWLVLERPHGVSSEDLERIALNEGAQIHTTVAPETEYDSIIVEERETHARVLANRKEAITPGERFRQDYGIGLSLNERIKALHVSRAMCTGVHYIWPAMIRLIVGCPQESERETLASLANTLGEGLAPSLRYVWAGAVRFAMQGFPACASAGVSLSLDTRTDLEALEWVLDHPQQLKNIRWIGFWAGETALAQTLLAKLAKREVDMLQLTQLGNTEWADLLPSVPENCRGLSFYYGTNTASIPQSLIRSKVWDHLRALNLHRNELRGKGLSLLVNAPKTTPFESLDLGYNQLESEDVATLATASWLVGIKQLSIKYNDAKGKGVRPLLTSPALADIEELDIGANEVGDPGVNALVKNKAITKLRVFECEGNHRSPLLSVKGAQSLANWKAAGSLVHLNLGKNKLGSEGVAALLNSTHLSGIKHLDVQYNHVTSDLVTLVGNNKTGMRPKLVNLTGNALGTAKFGDEPSTPAQPASNNPWHSADWLSECEELVLYNTSLDPTTLIQIVSSPQLSKLRSLNISSNNSLGVEAFRHLVTLPVVSQLENLEMLFCAKQAGIGEVIANSVLAKKLKSLQISSEGMSSAERAHVSNTFAGRVYMT